VIRLIISKGGVNKMRCYAEYYCKKDRSECSELCGGYRVLRALYGLSRIPLGYRYNMALIPQVKDVPAFEELNEFKENIVSNVREGSNLYIWGKSTGCGKTSWACKIMSYYFRKIAFTSGLENEGLYIYLPTFLNDLRDSFDSKDPEFKKQLEMVTSCNLLIIDDLGSEKLTEWVRERIVSIIHTRVSNGLSTIYTSNLSPDELRQEMGDRIASRVLGCSQIVEITGADRRGVR
jgi:DNA replication protein DnaC